MRIIRACHAGGIRVGRDLLLVGYDNLELTDQTDPPLTTIHQPFYELGLISIRKLVSVIYGKPEADETVRPWLVVRESA